MPPREWSPPVLDLRRGSPATSAEAPARSPRTEWGVLHDVVSFVFTLVFFGVIAGMLRLRFPIDLGLFLFFTDRELIERTLRRVGIELVPDTLGASFVEAFVWVTGATILFARWKHDMPAWLSSGFPAHASWSLIAGAALGCALLKVSATAFVRRALPLIGIELPRDSLAWTIAEGLLALALLGLCLLLLRTG
jgi:hypothetical protein